MSHHPLLLSWTDAGLGLKWWREGQYKWRKNNQGRNNFVKTVRPYICLTATSLKCRHDIDLPCAKFELGPTCSLFSDSLGSSESLPAKRRLWAVRQSCAKRKRSHTMLLLVFAGTGFSLFVFSLLRRRRAATAPSVVCESAHEAPL